MYKGDYYHPSFSQKIIKLKNTNIQIILPVILYSCETWTLTLREEKRLRIFENKVLRKIFGPERETRRQENGEGYITLS